MELSKPIYYSCDWDLAGLKIYSRIKAKLRNRNKDISLLYPNEPHKKINTYIDYHYSHWDLSKRLSGLSIDIFSKKELILINDLIQNQMWIEEESFNLDRKSTRLNSSHVKISYAVFCLKKKKKINYS